MPAFFSKSCEYSIRALMHLARHEHLVHLREIAQAERIPSHFLSKLLQTLARDGFVVSHKGLNGGFQLGRPASDITLLNIVHAIDGVAFDDDCILGIGGCNSNHPCAVHDAWKAPKLHILETLQNTTIQQLVGHSVTVPGNGSAKNSSFLPDLTSLKPTDLLRQEHRAIERALNVLERELRLAERGGQIRFKIIRDALRFIRSFADQCHHSKEEELLFPAMERKGFPRSAGPLAVMLQEHDAGRSHVRAMDESLERCEKGESQALATFTLHARAFIGLLRDHIQKEDQVLFVMADQHLSSADQAELSIEFLNKESAAEACSTKEDLLVLLEQLEHQ